MECPVCLEPKRDIPLLVCVAIRYARRAYLVLGSASVPCVETRSMITSRASKTLTISSGNTLMYTLLTSMYRFRLLPGCDKQEDAGGRCLHTRVNEGVNTPVIPATISEATVGEILSELTPSTRGDAPCARTTVSDKNKQKYRHNRNRWCEDMAQRRVRCP